MKNEELEIISDKIRQGTPVGILDAVAAIEYQERLRREHEYNSLWNKIKRFIKGNK